MKKWYHDKNGEVSSLRIVAIPAAYIGMGVVLSSVVAFFMGFADSVLMAGVGTGMVTTSLGAKAWQKGKE